jgi:phosphonate transport system substrate-binding protein
LVAGKDYTKVVLGAHDAVALAVANHKVDAGGLSLPIFKRLTKEGKISPSGVRVLAESMPIPEYMWTVREGVSPSLRLKLQKAFSELRDEKALGIFRAESFIEAKDSDVDIVRQWVESVRAASPEEFSKL